MFNNRDMLIIVVEVFMCWGFVDFLLLVLVVY